MLLHLNRAVVWHVLGRRAAAAAAVALAVQRMLLLQLARPSLIQYI
jgi:hypothetical protein